MKRLFAVLLLFVFICGFATGCDVSGNKEQIPTPYPVRVASVTIEKTPEKVVCLSPSLTELSYELGYGKRLVGRTEDALYPEEVKTLPTIGKTGNIDTEALIALEPDTVVSHQSLSKKEMDALEAARVKVVILPMVKSLEELEELYYRLSLLYVGQLDAKALADRHYQKLTDGLHAIKSVLPAEELENGFAYIIHPSNNIIATGDTLESSILSAVFGVNAAAEGTAYKIDAKLLAEKKPSVIFTADPYGLPHLQAAKSYKSLDAVKNEKVASIDNDMLALQSVRMVETVKTLAKALYPDLFSEEEASSESDSSNTNSQAAASSVSSVINM